MPNYIQKALQKYQHKPPARPQHAPMKWNRPDYGRKVQYAIEDENLDQLGKAETKEVQSKCGTFLYYGRAVDPTILVALNEIGRDQSRPTRKNATTIILVDGLLGNVS